MACFLLQRNGAEPGCNVIIAGTIAKQRTEIVLGHTEKAGADFAIGREANAIAVTAKRLADGRNDADFPLAVGESPAFRG
jgi:hypothetical protein